MRRFKILCCLFAAVFFLSPISGCGGTKENHNDDTPVVQDMNIPTDSGTADDDEDQPE